MDIIKISYNNLVCNLQNRKFKYTKHIYATKSSVCALQTPTSSELKKRASNKLLEDKIPSYHIGDCLNDDVDFFSEQTLVYSLLIVLRLLLHKINADKWKWRNISGVSSFFWRSRCI